MKTVELIASGRAHSSRATTPTDRLFPLAALGVLASSLSACVTLTGQPTTQVTVTTPPTVWAECTLTNKAGSQSLHSPETVFVNRSVSPLNIVCTKTGFETGSVTVRPGVNPLILGNVIFGLAGPAFAGLDIVAGSFTGATATYPASVQVPLIPNPDVPSEPDALQP